MALALGLEGEPHEVGMKADSLLIPETSAWGPCHQTLGGPNYTCSGGFFILVRKGRYFYNLRGT